MLVAFPQIQKLGTYGRNQIIMNYRSLRYDADDTKVHYKYIK